MVLERASAEFEIARGPVTLEDVLSADEAFITSSVRGVIPITRVDEREVGNGKVGPVTAELMALYQKATYGN